MSDKVCKVTHSNKLYTLQVGGFYLSFVVTACAVSVILIGTFFGVTNVDTKRDEDGGNLFR